MENLFSERLKETRTSQGLTQKQLAERAKTAPASFASYEKGVKTPSLDAALRIAQALNVSLDWLCGYSPTQSVVKFETLGDVLQVFLDLDSTGLRISLKNDTICADEDEAYSYEEIQTHQQNLTGGKEIAACVIKSERAIFLVSDKLFAKFFEKWQAIRKQYRSGVIDQELYTLWCEKQLSEAKTIPLPFVDK